MINDLRKEPIAVIAFLLFVTFSLWWLGLSSGYILEGTPMYDLFSDLYGVMALVGGIWGLIVSKSWGGYSSVMGRVILAFSFGLLFQVFGQVSYSYYYYALGIENPYPSVGDIGFFMTIPAYIYGVLNLARASGATINFGNVFKNPFTFLLPLGMLLSSYEIFLVGYDFTDVAPLVVFLDFTYPLGHAVYISLALLVLILSKDFLGGIMKSRVLLLLVALVAQYTAEFIFLYKTSRELSFAGGISEYLYFLSYFVMTIGIVELSLAFKKLKSEV